MDRPADDRENEDGIAALAIAEQAARLLRNLAEIEGRLEIVERTINRALLD